jgi:hypothetical protein
MGKVVIGVVLAFTLSGSFARAATQHILGKKLLVKDPSGNETSRLTLVLGKEPATGTGCADTIVGDPVANGATLSIFANGTASTTQTFPLPAGSSWSAIAGGFKWRDAANSQPVHLLKLWKTGSGICKFKALIKGADGGNLDVVPPNTGTDGGATLAIAGGDVYCINFGGTDGGTTVTNTNKVYEVLRPATDTACPSPPTTTSTSTSSTTSTSPVVTTSSTTTSTSTTTSSTSPFSLKFVFVTSTTYTGNLGGLSGADAICNTRAAAAGRSGTYMAWLSDSTASPSTRFTHAGPYANGSNVIASDWADLTDGTVGIFFEFTEFGTSLPVASGVWTDTNPDGTYDGTFGNCTGWTSTSGLAVFGVTNLADSNWTHLSAQGCNTSLHLYCFEQ